MNKTQKINLLTFLAFVTIVISLSVTSFYMMPEFRSQVCGHTGFCVNLCKWRKERGYRNQNTMEPCTENDTTKNAFVKLFEKREVEDNSPSVKKIELKP